MSERAFGFLRVNEREGKPRLRGLTEIRGPYYSVVGRRYLEDLLETMGAYVDGLKYAGGSFALMPRDAVRALNALCHEHDVYVSTGGFLEYVLTQGADAVDRYLDECRELGFDVVEVSSGFVSVPADDLVRLTERVVESGLKAKPEVGIQFGAGGASSVEVLEAEGTRDVGGAVELAQRHLQAGATTVMVESEGITEQVRDWRLDVVEQIVGALGLENVMFEAADPAVFGWYVKTYGADVNLFVDHSQIVQLECLRAGIWGTQDLWGRVLTYRPDAGVTESGRRERSRATAAKGGPMSTTGWHGGTMKLSDIRNDLENRDLTPTQRKSAFEHLRRWLRERPDDADAKELWSRFEAEFGREDADTPLARETSGEGFQALTDAERRAH